MKLPLRSLLALALAASAFTPAARAQISPFRLRVEQVTKADNEKTTKKQTRSLKIFVSNSSKENAALVAKYVFFGREAKGNDIVKIDEGEKAVTVGALATATVESGVATATFDEEHSSGYSKGKPGKMIEASGQKFVGYGVQLMQGDKMVAEYYDPPSGKEQWTKAYPAKLPAAPPAKKK